MSLSSDNTVMTMPVAPAYGGGYGSNGMWGDNFLSWIIILLLFGGRGFGFGGLGGFGGFGGLGGMLGGFGGWGSPYAQGVLTRADINDGFALQNLQNSQTSIKDAVTNGFHGVDNAVRNLGYQLQDCCCTTQRAIDGVNYNMATQAAGIQNAIQGVRYDMATQACDTRNTIQTSTRDIIDNANANSRAILQALNDNYIRSLENENQSLKLAASQSNQNAVLMAAMDANKAEILRRTGAECPTPAYVVQPPQPVTFPNFCNTCNSCGC